MGAAADCEAIGVGFLGQPINALTTLGFVLAGIIVIVRRRDGGWIGIGLIATGIGSFLFHGPMPPGNEWAHDVTLAWLVTMVAGWGSRWERFTHLPALAVIGLFFAVFPVIADPFAVVMTVVAVISILRRDRTRGHGRTPVASGGGSGVRPSRCHRRAPLRPGIPLPAACRLAPRRGYRSRLVGTG